VSDWLVPTTDLLAGRGMMGEGVIDLPRMRGLVDAAGYNGPIEVEVINPANAELPAAELMAKVSRSFAESS
jgi:sugar phosphate isomerase/epimerase